MAWIPRTSVFIPDTINTCLHAVMMSIITCNPTALARAGYVHHVWEVTSSMLQLSPEVSSGYLIP